MYTTTIPLLSEGLLSILYPNMMLMFISVRYTLILEHRYMLLIGKDSWQWLHLISIILTKEPDVIKLEFVPDIYRLTYLPYPLSIDIWSINFFRYARTSGRS